jgi:hypothetical protein
MFGTSEDSARPTLLIGTIKVAALVASVSFLTASWLSAGRLDQGGLAHVAGNTASVYDDPVTTGSILRSGDRTRLDPCAAPLRR